jgi:hypothetical protein
MFRATRLVLLASLLLAAPTGPLLAKPRQAAPASPPITALDLMGDSRTPALDWRWRAPPEAALDPRLFARLVRERDRNRAEAQADGERDRRARLPAPHVLMQQWAATFASQRLIVLLGETYAFTGGAHGNTGHRALLWDRAAGRERRLAELFSDWPAVQRLIQPAACAALWQEKAGRFAPAPVPGDWQCPALDEAVIVPQGRPGGDTVLRILYDPYVAGSFAEGIYDLGLEWPDGVRALARPEWRPVLFGTPR